MFVESSWRAWRSHTLGQLKINDAIIGALLALLGIAILVHIQDYPKIPGQKYGPAMFPGLIACGFIVCGALLAKRGVRDLAAGHSAIVLARWVHQWPQVTNFLAVIGALVFYILTADLLGFPITGSVLLISLFWKLGVRMMIGVPIAIIATALAQFLFYKMMRVPLPWGLLEGLAW
ncbi:MAG: tripartite tricarboxylate transporter TctB family protein [Burkholderiales bacterium]